MSSMESKRVVGRYLEEVINGRRLDGADELLTPDFAIDHAGLPGTVRTPAGFKGMIGAFFAAFPDLRATVEEMIGEGDTVAVRLTWRGTHRGEFNGIPASGRAFTVTGSAMYHLRDDQIARAWAELDVHALLQQLSAVPTPTQRA